MNDFLANLPTILTSGGVTGGSLLVTLSLLMARGTIWWNGAVVRLMDIKDQNILLLENQLKQKELDLEYYRAALETQRTRADTVSDKMVGELVPLVNTTNKLLSALPTVEGGETDDRRRGTQA